jgi:hypothetical protein
MTIGEAVAVLRGVQDRGGAEGASVRRMIEYVARLERAAGHMLVDLTASERDVTTFELADQAEWYAQKAATREPEWVTGFAALAKEMDRLGWDSDG